MSFLPEFGRPPAAGVPEHGRLRGLEVGDPHPQYSKPGHAHDFPVYYADGSDGAPTTSYTNLDAQEAALSLSPGRWLIQGRGHFEFSSAAAHTYFARIYNATAATELDAVQAGGTGITAGSLPWSLVAVTTLSQTSTIRIENKVSVIDGTQLVYAKIWATQVTAIS